MISLVSVVALLILVFIWGVYIWGWTKRELRKSQMIGTVAGIALSFLIVYGGPIANFLWFAPGHALAVFLLAIYPIVPTPSYILLISEMIVLPPLYTSFLSLLFKRTRLSVTLAIVGALVVVVASVVGTLLLVSSSLSL
ncbi:hypothetical protein CL628_04375 [bacterium]|nr:hypothetical protein [bacterium]